MAFSISGSFDADDFAERVVNDIKQDIIKRLESISCPEHGEHPEVTLSDSATKRDISDLRVSACCDKVIELVKKEMGNDS